MNFSFSKLVQILFEFPISNLKNQYLIQAFVLKTSKRHIRQVHFLNRNILCNFKKQCKQRFGSLQEFEVHVRTLHSSKETALPFDSTDFSQRCQCNLVSCGNMIFKSVKDFVAHYNVYHKADRRICIFKNCNKWFQPGFVSRNHFWREHYQKNNAEIKEEFLYIQSHLDATDTDNNCPGCENDDIAISDYDEENYDDHAEIEERVNDHEDVINEDLVKALADTLNRLSFIKMVPQSTIDIIIFDFLQLFSKSIERQATEIRKFLLQQEVQSNIIQKVESILKNNHCIQGLKKLETTSKRDSFIANNFDIVQPQEIILNPQEVKRGNKKESYMYVPLQKSVITLFEDKTFLQVLERSQNEIRQPQDYDVIRDVKDGTHYKGNKYFKENPDAFCGLLYSDGIEVVNPLGKPQFQS